METLYKTKKWFRAAVWAVPLLVCAGLWFWGARASDIYSNYVPGDECSIEGYEDTPQTGYAQYRGQMIGEFKRETLPPGTYVLDILYRTTAGGGRCEVFDPETQAVLATGGYDPGQEKVTVTFERKNGQFGVAVRSYQGEDELQIVEYQLHSVGPVYTDAFWILGLGALLAAYFWRCLRRFRAGRPRELQLLALACVFSLPYLSDHLQNGQDIPVHIGRLYGIGVALRSGQFPVRLEPDLFSTMGGYIDPIMYPDLFLYLSGAMCALGASALLALKVLYILINFLTVYCGYYGAKQLAGEETGMAFALLYMCCPYRLNDIFARAAVGEALAMAFLPLAAAGIYQLLQGDYKKGFWTALLGITGILESHVLSVFLLVIFGVLYGAAVLLWQGKRFWADRRRSLTLLAAAAATVALNAWFVVPFLQFSARFDFTAFHINGTLKKVKVYPWQMFMENYKADGGLPGTQTYDQMPFTIGSVLLLCILLMLCRWLRDPHGHPREIALQKCLLALGTVAVFMTSMAFPWQQLEERIIIQKTFDKLQFPWRFLTVAAVLYTLAAAVELLLLCRDKKKITAAILTALAVLSAINTASQYFYKNRTYLADKTADRPRVIWGGREYVLDTPVWPCDAALEGIVPLTDGALAEGYDRQGTDLSFAFTNADPAQAAVFRLPQYNYTLHKATLENGQELGIDTDPETGLMLLTVPAGITGGTVQVRYHAPLSFRLAEGVSLLAAVLLALLWRRRHRPGKIQAAPLTNDG